MDGKTYEVKMNDLYEAILQLEKENAELRKRAEWQPMETCPYSKVVMAKQKDSHPIAVWRDTKENFDVVVDANTVATYSLDDLVGWKEV